MHACVKEAGVKEWMDFRKGKEKRKTEVDIL